MKWLIGAAIFIYLYEKGKLPRALMDAISGAVNSPASTSQGDLNAGATILPVSAQLPTSSIAAPGGCVGCSKASSPVNAPFPGAPVIRIPGGTPLVAIPSPLSPSAPSSSFVNNAISRSEFLQ